MLEKKIIDPTDVKQLELYIHIPFCARKCNYCDFLSFPVKEQDHAEYVEKLCREIALGAEPASENREVSSVFIGGGTPSLIDPRHIVHIMDEVRDHFSVRKDAEITIECNPASTLRYKFSLYKEAGINRLSLGLQSANDSELRMLGRIHAFDDFLKCFQNARMEGFSNINVDLMNDIPGQTLKSWNETLKHVLMLKPEHVSIYNLIVEEGTPFMKMYKDGTLALPDEETASEIDEITRVLTGKYGYNRYEVSNYAKPGYECRHNYGYWSNVSYLGFGLGAASYFSGKRWSNTRDFRRYMELDFSDDMKAGFSLLRTDEQILSKEDQMEEFMFLGLRRIEGISEVEFKQRFQMDIMSVFGSELEKYVSQGFIIHDGYRFRFSDRGMDVSNVILSQFLIDR
ncbi:radical SAM family heme chaperone HemW [Oribacterium sp. WCC10]|uniref:radical SAM family heme chaperone HemW n=1 Tax=Oribacterium sp. WCC10 TaxID=1855343 RepID=UPI0008EC1B84|nr:radical SAM family heme chaperone HemW [Oribacterium sp. WCC10]SFG39155.1 oxygen-independent coproporphyrinogen-3 oxidase [Oribacterium sp. WCC10]